MPDVDLLSLVPGLQPMRGSRRYWAGPCPWCGGQDRFQVRVGDSGRPDLWICRSCTPRYRDAVAFVQRRDRVGYRHAIAILEGAPRAAERPKPEPPVDRDTWRDLLVDPLEAAELRMWRAGEYLTGRGISMATAQHWRLGYVDRGTGHGLPGRPASPDAPIRDVWLPSAAVLFPWRRDRRLDAVKLRHMDGDGDMRYTCVWGSQPVLYGAETLPGRSIAVLCEGEIDTLLLWQAVGDLVGTITFGSCLPHIPDEALPHLRHLRWVLVAYDSDAPSEKAVKGLLRTSKRFRRLRPPVPPGAGKDIGDAVKAGVDVRQWVLRALQVAL